MAVAVANGGWNVRRAGSVPMLGLLMEVGDMIRCRSCLVSVEHYFVGTGKSAKLVGLRCRACHRWRAVTAKGLAKGE